MPKVAKVNCKPSPATKSTTSSSSARTNKSSSGNGVKKATNPAPQQKPKNVDKGDFGKPKPQADAGVYKPLSQNPAMRCEAEKAEYYERIAKRARKELDAEKSVKSGAGSVAAEILEDTAIVVATGAEGPVGGLGAASAIKLHNHSQKEKDKMTISQKIVYNIMTEPNSGQNRLDEMEFVYQHRKEIDECKEITRKIDKANEEARKKHEGE